MMESMRKVQKTTKTTTRVTLNNIDLGKALHTCGLIPADGKAEFRADGHGYFEEFEQLEVIVTYEMTEES